MPGYKDLIEQAQRLVYDEWIERDGGVIDRAYIIEELIEAVESLTQRRAVVEAQALEQAAEAIELYQVHAVTVGGENVVSFREGATKDAQAWLRARAVEIREGRQ